MAKSNQATTETMAQQMSERACEAAQLLKVLANEKRLMILCLLSEQERSVSELNELVELSQSALSQHLAVLREEGLVTTRREAQTIYYSSNSEPVMKILATLEDIYVTQNRSRSAA